MHIVFIDDTASVPYKLRDLRTTGMGGTEGTVLRVASRLALDCKVTLAQRYRTRTETDEQKIHYVPTEDLCNGRIRDPDVLICIRKLNLLTRFGFRFPNAKKVLWLHNRPRMELRFYKPLLRLQRATVVCVSKYHKNCAQSVLNEDWLSRASRWIGGGRPVPVCHIYNPIDDDLSANGNTINPDKLVCFSSPRRDLETTLKKFAKLRDQIPSLQLYLSTPVYGAEQMQMILANSEFDTSNVHFLGSLPQRDVHRHIRQALCVFYPQTTIPETFGLVYAEANALGTPVIAHDLGAAAEVLSKANPLTDCDNGDAILRTLRRWREQARPKVSAAAKFRLAHVTEAWLAQLGVNSRSRVTEETSVAAYNRTAAQTRPGL